jgi:hypothetical protein
MEFHSDATLIRIRDDNQAMLTIFGGERTLPLSNAQGRRGAPSGHPEYYEKVMSWRLA